MRIAPRIPDDEHRLTEFVNGQLVVADRQQSISSEGRKRQL
jgi:hypothetical protein